MLSPNIGQRPKILIIPTFSEYGGTLTFFLRLLAVHRRNGLNTAVLIPRNQQHANVLEAFKEAQVRLYIGPNRPALFYKYYISLIYDIIFCWKAFWSFRPDLILVSTGSVALMLGALIYPVPVIFAIHSVPPADSKSRKWLGMRYFVQLISGFGDKLFLSVSHSSARSIQKYLGVPPQRVRVIYNSFRSDLAKTQAASRKMVLTIGHLVDYKNPKIWLAVIRKVLAVEPDVQFVWLGDGIMLDSMRQEISRLGLMEQVVLPGYFAEVDDFYSQAVVYFQPSLQESHGIAVVEAMAHGLPCLTSNVGGLPESVVDGETGFLCAPDDVDGFSVRILELLDDPELRSRMGQAGQQRAAFLFSETVQEQEILNLYRSLLPQIQELYG